MLILKQQAFIARPATELQRAFEQLWHGQQELDVSLLRFRLVELLFLITHAKPKNDDHMHYFSSKQVHLVRAAQRLLSRDLSHKTTIEEVARQLSVSPSSLKGYFIGVNGIGISRYMQGLRVEEATHLLKDSNLNIGDIALRVGYENQSKFAAVFKRVKGMSPLEYHRKKRIEKSY